MKTKWKVIIAVILAVVISVGSISAYKYITSPKEESISLETTLEDAAELTTQKMIISDVFKSTKGNIPLINKNKFLVQYKTTVTAGLDVKKAKIKETDDEIRITIPHCMINEDSIKIKSSDLKIYDTNFAIMSIDKEAVIEVVAEAEEKLSAFAEDAARVEQFLELARKYTDFSELTTPMINEFIEKIIVHAPERIDGDRVQEVEIHLRFIGQFELPAPELTEEEIKRQEQLKRHRIKSRERYQKIKAGEHAVGQPFTLTCKCCGQEFASKRTNTLFCGPNCRAKFYRQEAAESRSRACTCENCGKEFITTRSDVKYCSDDCRYAAQIKRQGARKKALREAKIEPAVPEKETKTA